MREPLTHENNWDTLIQLFLTRLDIPNKTDIDVLNERIDKLEQLLYQKKSMSGQVAGGVMGRRKSASSTVLDVIGNHPKGTDFKTIKAATGFNDKKLRNIIFRLDKIKKIVRVKRGIYKKA